MALFGKNPFYSTAFQAADINDAAAQFAADKTISGTALANANLALIILDKSAQSPNGKFWASAVFYYGDASGLDPRYAEAEASGLFQLSAQQSYQIYLGAIQTAYNTLIAEKLLAAQLQANTILNQLLGQNHPADAQPGDPIGTLRDGMVKSVLLELMSDPNNPAYIWYPQGTPLANAAQAQLAGSK